MTLDNIDTKFELICLPQTESCKIEYVYETPFCESSHTCM